MDNEFPNKLTSAPASIGPLQPDTEEGKAATASILGNAPGGDTLASSALVDDCNNFNFIRWFLAVLVLFSHVFILNKWAEPIGEWTHLNFDGGTTAVDMFLIISGFMITRSLERSSSHGNFMLKRFLRIWPAFVVAALVSVLVFGYLGATNPDTYFWNLSQIGIGNNLIRIALLQEPAHPLLFAHVAVPRNLNGALWTIPYEFCFYIGLLALSTPLRNRWVALLFCCASYAFLSHQAPTPSNAAVSSRPCICRGC